MRFLNKYQLSSKLGSSKRRRPLRIAAFKRPKWNFLKRQFFFRKKKKKNRSNNLFLKKQVVQKPYPRIRNSYKSRLKLKNYLQSLFGTSFSFKSKTNTKIKEKLILLNLIKPLFKIDTILWYLNFFSSPHEAMQNINNKNILVNGKRVKANYFIKGGDILTFNFKINLLELNSCVNNRKKFLRNCMYFSFLEIDYYSNMIVVIKDYQDLTFDDFKLLIEKNIELKNLL